MNELQCECGNRASVKAPDGTLRCVACHEVWLRSAEAVGTIGVVCGATSQNRIVRKTASGPLHRGVCNRWHGHGGKHRQVRGRDFALLAEWTDGECIVRDYKDIARVERQRSAAALRFAQ